MKWAQSLIRIADHEIDGLRIRLAEVVDRRTTLEMRIAVLDAEADSETVRARTDAEAGWYLVGFREGWRLRKDQALAELAGLELEEAGARDALALAYEGLKKVERVVDLAEAAAVRERARLETLALDEVALRRSRR